MVEDDEGAEAGARLGADIVRSCRSSKAVALLVGQAGADQASRPPFGEGSRYSMTKVRTGVCSTMSAKSFSSISAMPPPGWRARDSGAAADTAPRSPRACRR